MCLHLAYPVPAALSAHHIGAVPPPFPVAAFMPLMKPASDFEAKESFGIDEVVSKLGSSLSSLPEKTATPFSAEEWIERFEHNATHVKMAAGNETLELLWQDELVNLLFVNINDKFNQLKLEWGTNYRFNGDVAGCRIRFMLFK